MELCERLAYYGMSMNLIVYMTSILGVLTADATVQLQVWGGCCYVTPLIGAYLADAYLGRYRTIIIFSIVYFMGLVLMTLLAALPALAPVPGTPISTSQLAVFWTAMALIALGTGGIKPCVSAFGADQFRQEYPREVQLRSTFYNYFYFAINVGSLVASLLIVWIQQDISWAWGFGIPAAAFLIAIVLFVCGTRLYSYAPISGSVFSRVSGTIYAALRKARLPLPEDPATQLYETPGGESAVQGTDKMEHTEGVRWLDHAAIATDIPKLARWQRTITHCEELKCMIRLLPIMLTLIVWQMVYAQMGTLFVLQGMAMDTQMGNFTIPAASLSAVNTIAVMICVVLYDRVISPLARRFGRPITLTQRIGWGYAIGIAAMIVSAGLETVRLQVVQDNNLQYVPYQENSANPDAEYTPVPISIWWQVPQYFLVGAAEVFTNIGAMELCYTQAPDSMRAFSTALYLLTSAVGNYLSSVLVIAVQALTDGGDSAGGWVANNANVAHLDYFFWLLAVLQVLDLIIYVPIAYWFRVRKAPTPKRSLDVSKQGSISDTGALVQLVSCSTQAPNEQGNGDPTAVAVVTVSGASRQRSHAHAPSDGRADQV